MKHKEYEIQKGFLTASLSSARTRQAGGKGTLRPPQEGLPAGVTAHLQHREGWILTPHPQGPSERTSQGPSPKLLSGRSRTWTRVSDGWAPAGTAMLSRKQDTAQEMRLLGTMHPPARQGHRLWHQVRWCRVAGTGQRSNRRPGVHLCTASF